MPALPARVVVMRNAQRTALVLLSVLLALALPDFEFLVAFIGAFCMGLIAYVLPPLMVCTLLLKREERQESGSLGVLTLASLLGHGLLCALGVLVFAGGTFQVVREKWRGH